jgi:hypothetical protein
MKKSLHPPQQQDKRHLEIAEPPILGLETCMNPWNGRCSNTDITLYIIYEGSRLPICRKCWEAISSNDHEWVYD